MPPREPTRAQLSSKLSYQSHTPSFLQKFQNRMNGIQDDEEDDEFEDDGSGRPPIPRRPAIPERPHEDPGSADEDDGDEKPQVVVLKAGKHLTEREAENIRRAEKGLPPLPEPKDGTDEIETDQPKESSSSTSKSGIQGLSFSSSSKPSLKSNKRKAMGLLDDLIKDEDKSKGKGAKKNPAKRAKKSEKKTLLSFGDDT